ncbi:MAG: ABC transporter ATP-binding protein [Candidatus Nanopelagicales bacterium]|nr:ABC transporter ATP-binding protein [Candidatus Nanopelagicales bacterium]
MADPVLDVSDLSVRISSRDGEARAVNGISFSVNAGEAVALLGESGSGKSMTALAVMGMLPERARIVSGSIRLSGTELVGATEKEYRQIRGRRIAIVFQDALSALNPVVSVGRQVAEMFTVHEHLGHADARAAAIDAMTRVRIPSAAQRYGDYPHQFSGGMRQRILIAMMIALRPEVLIADEPTTALDVTVEAAIMDLLTELRAETGMGLVLITHDLGVAASAADRVTVMYAGRAMEQGETAVVLSNTAHPYTQGLMRSVAPLDDGSGRLPAIPGLPPSLMKLPSGCLFRPRCALAIDLCAREPEWSLAAPDHWSRCWRADEVMSHG